MEALVAGIDAKEISPQPIVSWRQFVEHRLTIRASDTLDLGSASDLDVYPRQRFPFMSYQHGKASVHLRAMIKAGRYGTSKSRS
jgi:hypothetical protein